MNQEEIDYWAGVIPVVPAEIEYRLYYNDLGEIVAGSMSEPHENLPQYITVTEQQYDTYFNYRVVNGELKQIERDTVGSVKLQKSNLGFCVVKNHAGLVLEQNETYIETEYYAHRDS